MQDQEYEIRVDGPIPEEEVAALGGLQTTDEPVVTVLRGPVADQAALHGILARLRGLGLQIVEVRRLPAPRRERGDESSVQPPAERRGERSPRTGEG